MSDEPIIIPENKSIIPAQSNLPAIWQPKRALPVLGAAATLIWLGRLLVRRNAQAPTIHIPESRPRAIAPQQQPEFERSQGRRVIFRYSASWTVSVWEDE